MLGYPTVYAFFNFFLEDLNGYFLIGDGLSKIIAFTAFGFNIWLGFWITAKRKELGVPSDVWLGVMAGILICGIILKAIKEELFIVFLIKRNFYYINIWLLPLALLSFTLAAICQENILKDVWGDLYCDPKGILQAHACWHIFSAFSLFISMYIFYTEEEYNYSFESRVKIEDIYQIENG